MERHPGTAPSLSSATNRCSAKGKTALTSVWRFLRLRLRLLLLLLLLRRRRRPSSSLLSSAPFPLRRISAPDRQWRASRLRITKSELPLEFFTVPLQRRIMSAAQCLIASSHRFGQFPSAGPPDRPPRSSLCPAVRQSSRPVGPNAAIRPVLQVSASYPPPLLSSRLPAHGSRLTAHGSRLTAHDLKSAPMTSTAHRSTP
jgi:hypothetical protein